MIAPGQRHDRREQETRIDDKKRKTRTRASHPSGGQNINGHASYGDESENEPSKGGYGLTVRIVDGTFTEPGEPKIVAPRPGARDILNPALAGLWMRRGGGDLLNVYRALLDVHQHVLCVLSFDCLPRSDSRSGASTASVKHPRSTIRTYLTLGSSTNGDQQAS